MSMSTSDGSGGMVSEINVTPLADVMLVLLIIFMITAPLMSHSVTIDLPTADPKTPEAEMTTTPLDLALKLDGSMYLDDREVTATELQARLAVEAQKSPQPQLQIRADKEVEFKAVKQVIGDAKDSGMVHVAFMTTDPVKG